MSFRDYSRQGIHYYSGNVQSQQWPFGMNILANVIEFQYFLPFLLVSRNSSVFVQIHTPTLT